MKPVIALLPLDDRPANYDYPVYLARIAGYTLHLPPREGLGNPWRAAQHARLVDWLAAQAETAELLIVAIDTLAYGGLIPSRISTESLDSVLQRLAILKTVKAKRPSLPILASSVILRISRANSSEEEKEYWAAYGSAMFRLSYLDHKSSLGEASPEEQAEKLELIKQIPQEVHTDYRAGRRRNHQINLAMIDWLEQGIFDYLLLPQDDTADYGWNIAEARLLQAALRQRNLTQRAITYPGADEIGCLLLAAAVCQQARFSPKVFLHFSSVLSPSVTTSYEDRPILELVKAHLAPLGGVIAPSPEKADFLLYMNGPVHSQGEASLQWLLAKSMLHPKGDISAGLKTSIGELSKDPLYRITQYEMQSPQRSLEEFIRSMLVNLASKQQIALADVAFANGADLQLGNLLIQHKEFARLLGYSGWNTAGNSLGSLLAHTVLRLLSIKSGDDPDRVRAHFEFLFLRILDDYFYQSIERSACMFEDLPALGLQPTMECLPSPQVETVEERVRQRLAKAAQELERLFINAGVVRSMKVEHIHLPWQRLFEVGFDVHVEL